jgi:membrane fusion protein, multidrug efflux system
MSATQDADQSPAVASAETVTVRSNRRLLLVAGPVVAAVLAAGFYLLSGRYESTDDAYLRAAQVPISANVSGRVIELEVHDNQHVHRNDILFRLDDAPFRIAVAEAEAQLGKARLQVESLKATYRQKQADVAAARDTLVYRQSEYERQQRLLSKGIASQAQFDAATHAFKDAQQELNSEQQQIASVLASLDGNPDIPPAKHPLVLEAQAQLDRTKLDLSYTVVTAPEDGVVTKVEQLQIGSYINASKPVFALVSTQDVWVEANFKEVQLTHMRPGQAATIDIDALPGRTFVAHVTSVSPGTGNEFSALPAENATGNWVKVVQRVPVRLELDDQSGLDAAQSGLSASVRVDTEYRRHWFGGNRLAQADAGR